MPLWSRRMRSLLPLTSKDVGTGSNKVQFPELFGICLAGLGVALEIPQIPQTSPTIFKPFLWVLLQICFNLYFVAVYSRRLQFDPERSAAIDHIALFSGIMVFNVVVIILMSPPLPLIVIPILIFVFSASFIVRGYILNRSSSKRIINRRTHPPPCADHVTVYIDSDQAYSEGRGAEKRGLKRNREPERSRRTNGIVNQKRGRKQPDGDNETEATNDDKVVRSNFAVEERTILPEM